MSSQIWCGSFLLFLYVFPLFQSFFLFRVITESECAEEQAEIERREREEAEHAEHTIAAHSHAFDLARAGKGIETCQLINEFISKPLEPEGKRKRNPEME